jgi:hypothetical protein
MSSSSVINNYVHAEQCRSPVLKIVGGLSAVAIVAIVAVQLLLTNHADSRPRTVLCNLSP